MSMYTESLRAFLKPVLPYLDDDSVSEIMINGPDDVWIERRGRVYKTDARFSEEGLLGAARNMAQFVGRALSDERPRLDARLPDGSRIHVVLPPIARRGTTISIRKFFKDRPTVDTLLRFGSLTPPIVRLLEAAIRMKLNLIVSGGTGSGKTTLLNILSSLIPDEERILTIEDSAELQLAQSHLVSFESRPPDKFGKGGVDMGDLLHSALRLRPDRIIVGEVRGGECSHLVQAMNTGHGGSLSTCHANTPTDTLRRLESLCLMSAVELPLVAVRAQVASAIQLIVCCERLPDGSRKVTHVSEVLPLNERGDYRTQDLFVFTPVGKDEQGNVIGYHAPTGVIPALATRARAYGFPDLDERFFDPATYGIPPPPAFHAGEDFTVRWAPSLKHRQKGLPDPEELKAQWVSFEQKLKEEARARNAANVGAPAPAASAPPPPLATASTAPTSPAASASLVPRRSTVPTIPTRPPRSTPSPGIRAPVSEPPGRDDDKTPPPTRNPLDDIEDLDVLGSHDEETRVTEEPRRVVDEPKVEVSEELLSEVQDALEERPPAPRRAAAPPPAPLPAPARAAVAPRPAPQPPPSRRPPPPPRAALEEDDDDGTTALDDPDKTRIKAVPEKLRR